MILAARPRRSTSEAPMAWRLRGRERSDCGSRRPAAPLRHAEGRAFFVEYVKTDERRIALCRSFSRRMQCRLIGKTQVVAKLDDARRGGSDSHERFEPSISWLVPAVLSDVADRGIPNGMGDADLSRLGLAPVEFGQSVI